MPVQFTGTYNSIALNHRIIGTYMLFNSLTDNKILDKSKIKAPADGTINMTQKLKVVLRHVENILGKGENGGWQHFLLFPRCFQKPPYSELLKLVILW